MKWEGANGAMVLGQMIFDRDRIEYGYINQMNTYIHISVM